MSRQRLGFRASWRIAMSTVSVSADGALPLAHALSWWVRGVPTQEVQQALGPSRWDLMSPWERRCYVGISAICIVVLIGVLLAVALTTS